MNNKLFDTVQEAHDGKGRVVFICKDTNGLYVYKPQSGFKSRHYTEDTEDTEGLAACFDRQKGCNHTHAFYEDSERPAVDEEYLLPGVLQGVAKAKKKVK
jgi:hypothetical protein